MVGDGHIKRGVGGRLEAVARTQPQTSLACGPLVALIMAHERHVFDAAGGRPNRRLIESARRNPGAAKKSVQIVSEKQNSCYTGPLAETDLRAL